MSEQGTQVEQARRPGRWTLVRDILSFTGGWALVFMEVQRAELRESVLVFAATVVGVPAAAVGLQAVTDAVASRRTNGQSSPSAEPAQSASPPSSSSS